MPIHAAIKPGIVLAVILLFMGKAGSNAQTVITGGYVSGTWTSAGSPYIIQDDILVHTDSTLEIDAGTAVLFTGPYTLEVQGKLLALGSADSPVIFDRENDAVAWRGIFINTTDTTWRDSTRLEHGIISHCSNSCVTISYSSRVRITGFTISHGESFRGGGINCRYSNPRFENVSVTDNHALDGAGIALEMSDAYMTGCTISNNTADGAGGGMVIFDSSLSYLENCSIMDNQSIGSGGGVYVNKSSPIFERCDFIGNEGAIGGSNLYSGGAVSVKLNCVLNLINCTFNGNISHTNGGGIASFSFNQIINCLFAGNNADSLGGGIYIASGDLEQSHINNCTFIDNDSPGGTALAAYYHLGILRNSILWHSDPLNPGSLIFLDAVSSVNVLDARYNDIQNGQSGIEQSPMAHYIWGEGNIDLDPEFEAGGYSLSWKSPCIEAGMPDLTGYNYPELDLDGNPRIVNERIDIGGYEYQLPVRIPDSIFHIPGLLRIYPVPAKEYVIVEVPGGHVQGILQLVNGSGKMVLEIEMASQSIKVDTEGLAPGIYVARIISKDGSMVKKFLIF